MAMVPSPLPTSTEPLPIVPVVGPQFCEPSSLQLTVTKKAFSFSGGDFTVTDANSRKIMQVEGRVGFQWKRVFYDTVFTPIISMRCNVMSMRGTRKVYRGDSSDPRELLFTVKRSSISELTTKLDIILAENINQQHCDFMVKATRSGTSCIFYLGDSDTVIARMVRQYKFKNTLITGTYSVTVYPNVDYAFVVAIIVIVVEMETASDWGGPSGGAPWRPQGTGPPPRISYSSVNLN